jgi:hypothetical protein
MIQMASQPASQTASSVNKRSAALVSWGCQRMDAFGIGSDKALWQKYRNAPTDHRHWESLGGWFTSPPAVVTPAAGLLHVFVRGTGDNAWHRHYNASSWEPWENLGGSFLGPLTATSWGPTRVDVFGQGTDGSFWHRFLDGSSGWSSSWTNLQGSFVSEPAAISWGPDRIDVFGRGSDNAIWHRSYDNGAWSPSWVSLGGSLISPPTVVSWGPGRLDIFAIGSDNAIWQRFYDGGAWSSAWYSLGGKFTSSVSAITSSFFGMNRIDIFGIWGSGETGPLYHKAWSGLSWTSWTSHGGDFASKPALSSWAPNRIDMVIVASDTSMMHQAWNGTSWSPPIPNFNALTGSFIKFA